MPPWNEHPNRASFAVDRGAFDPPPLVGIGSAFRTQVNSWVWRLMFLGLLGLFVFTMWPAEIVRGELSYLGLQQETFAGNVDFIQIDGEAATGTFRKERWAVGGEIVVRGQPSPGEPGDESWRVNAFETTIPADTLESFIAMAEMAGTEVRVLPREGQPVT